MSDYQKTNVRFNNFGLNITHDSTTLPIGKFTYLTNAVSTFEGNLQARAGLTKGNTSAISGSPIIEGFRRLNNSVYSGTSFIVRAGTNLYISSNTTIPFTIGSPVVTGLSSSYGSLIIYRPNLSSSPWTYSYDTGGMWKTDGVNVHPVGYQRPHSVHTTGSQDFAATLGASASGSLTASTTYYYRFALYASTTGVESLFNLVPDGGIVADVNATTDASHLNIDVKLPDLTLNTANGAAYAGVDKARIYRYGGSSATWTLIATVAYTGSTTTYNDSASDLSVQGLTAIDAVSDQPFVTTSLSGVATPGTALPYAADPYLGYVLAVGDPNNPGFLYWTNKFNPDRHNPGNSIEITSPQDPLQNVFVYNGRPYVFSKEGLYELYIGLSTSSAFTPSKTACRHGLFTPLCFALGPEIYYLGKDGIYATSGGVERSLTDDELRPVFQGTATVGDVTAVDYTQPAWLRMAFYRNELWFMYRDTNNQTNHLVYDVRYRRWRRVVFRINTASIYNDEEFSSQLWFGTTNGYLMQHSGTADVGGFDTTVPVEVATTSMTFGKPLVNKEFGQLIIDLNPNGAFVTVTASMNTKLGTNVQKVGTTSASGRTKLFIDLNSTYAEDLLIDFQWATNTASPIIYGYELLWRDEEPEITTFSVPATAHGMEGWQIVRSAYITATADGTLNLAVSVLNDTGSPTTSNYTVGHPGGNVRAKIFIPFNPTKGKLFKYVLTNGTSTKFRFYPEQSEVHVKPWVTTLGYQRANPFAGGIGTPEDSATGGGTNGGMDAGPQDDPGGVGGAVGSGILGSPAYAGSGYDTAAGGVILDSTSQTSPDSGTLPTMGPGSGGAPDPGPAPDPGAGLI